MKVNVNEVKPGYIIEYRDKLWTLVKGEHVKPGKGPAYLQAELRCLTDGTKLNQRFNTSETVEQVHLDLAEYQFLYEEGPQLHFMNNETYEQVALPRDLIGRQAVFLKEGATVTVSSYEERPLSVRIPETAIFEVVEADPVIKGQTATASYKPAILDNGVRIMVPPHIEAGTKVVVNTTDSSYVERAKG
ncbi:elongation factor P [Geminicoccaceae bacterium 1502E]|nr:elongation factor P [Geminicoccaceae bacterium 1502E]